MVDDPRMSFEEIRGKLLTEGYKFPKKNYGDFIPITGPSGFPVGRLERAVGSRPALVCVSYRVEADGLPAVMQLHRDCQSNGLPYVLSDASHRLDRLDGEIVYRRNLIKGMKKLMKTDEKLGK